MEIDRGLEMPARMTSSFTPAGAKRRQIMTTAALAVIGVAARPAAADLNSEISRTEESIHQTRVFNAERKRVYQALTTENQFDKITQLSGVMKSKAMAKWQQPTKLIPHVGSPFALFGGYIIGNQIELVPDELIVQAWRVLSWPRGLYSIARFELSDHAEATELVFDHAAFPTGQAEHLATGWQQNYWDPLTKLLT
jgi:activator of HSP90 ATPase